MESVLFFFFFLAKNPNLKKRNVTVCNKCHRGPLIMTLIPGCCDLKHSQGTRVLHRASIIILFYFSV